MTGAGSRRPPFYDDLGNGRLFSPTCPRNGPPMIARLALLLQGRRGPVLEIGAGTGQHAAAFALAFPDLDWWPSDPDPDHRISIAAWARYLGAPERAPFDLDAARDWAERDDIRALGPLAAVLSMNVIHIAPWAVARGIVAGAARALARDGMLLFYGPFHENGQPTGPGNRAFDQSLRAQCPDWGIRDLDQMRALGAEAGLTLTQVIGMPADNRLLVFRNPD